jgi:hypothetical protein
MMNKIMSEREQEIRVSLNADKMLRKAIDNKNKMTQKEQLLKYFQEEDFSITTLECMQKLLILDLQGTIRDLKNDGHRIESFFITRKNMYGDKKTFKRYYLIQSEHDYSQFEREREVLKGVTL